MATDEEFRRSKEKGLKFELILLDYLRKSDPDAKVISGNEIRFDIVCPNTGKTYETKYDFKSNETNNFAVETESEGKSSGLCLSQADFWVFYDGRYAFLIATESLRYIINSENFRSFSGKVEGKEMKKLILIPKSKFFSSPYVKIVKLNEQH